MLVRPYRRSRLVVAAAAGVVLAVLLVAAWWVFTSSSNNKGKIEGKWSLLTAEGAGRDSFLAKFAAMAGARASPGDWLRSGQVVLILEFGKDMKLGCLIKFTNPDLSTGMTNPLPGTYSRGAGNDVTLKLFGKDYVVKVTIDGDKLTMTASDGFTMYFKKVE
jgi:hypothetical protein